MNEFVLSREGDCKSVRERWCIHHTCWGNVLGSCCASELVGQWPVVWRPQGPVMIAEGCFLLTQSRAFKWPILGGVKIIKLLFP